MLGIELNGLDGFPFVFFLFVCWEDLIAQKSVKIRHCKNTQDDKAKHIKGWKGINQDSAIAGVPAPEFDSEVVEREGVRLPPRRGYLPLALPGRDGFGDCGCGCGCGVEGLEGEVG